MNEWEAVSLQTFEKKSDYILLILEPKITTRSPAKEARLRIAQSEATFQTALNDAHWGMFYELLGDNISDLWKWWRSSWPSWLTVSSLQLLSGSSLIRSCVLGLALNECTTAYDGRLVSCGMLQNKTDSYKVTKPVKEAKHRYKKCSRRMWKGLMVVTSPSGTCAGTWLSLQKLVYPCACVYVFFDYITKTPGCHWSAVCECTSQLTLSSC